MAPFLEGRSEELMSLLDELRKKQHVLKSLGIGVRAEAEKVGASFSYIDPANPDVIIVERRGVVSGLGLSIDNVLPATR